MDDAVFILDSNVFIEAAKHYYAFDIAPGFWDELLDHASNGRIISIDRVKTELERQNDNLTHWATTHFGVWFVSTNETDVTRCYGNYINWVMSHPDLKEAAKAEFARADNADGWVIAYSEARSGIVVTHEELDSANRKKVKIPNVCKQFRVPYINTFEMLRHLGVRWA